MTEVEKFENTIATLTRKREACVKRGTELADERAAVALAAHTGDAKAAKRLAEIHTALATQASEVASFDAALKAAGEKLAAAERAEAAEQDRVAAKALRGVVAEIERMRRADEHAAALVKELLEADAAIEAVHASSPFPTWTQLKINVEFALKTMLMRLPNVWWRDWSEHLPPGRRQTFSEFWSKMAVVLENNIRQRAGQSLLPGSSPPLSAQEKLQAVREAVGSPKAKPPAERGAIT